MRRHVLRPAPLFPIIFSYRPSASRPLPCPSPFVRGVLFSSNGFDREHRPPSGRRPPPSAARRIFFFLRGGGSAPPTSLPRESPLSRSTQSEGKAWPSATATGPPPTHKTPPVKPTPKMWTENLRVEDAGGATTNPYSPRVLGNKAAPNRGSTARKKEKKEHGPLRKAKSHQKRADARLSEK